MLLKAGPFHLYKSEKKHNADTNLETYSYTIQYIYQLKKVFLTSHKSRKN